MKQSISERIHALRMWFKTQHSSIHHSQHRPSPQRIRSTALEIKRVDIQDLPARQVR